MLRNVYLQGELGQKFIPHLEMEFTKPAEVFQCLNANFDEFRPHLIKKYDEGVEFDIQIGGSDIEDPRELLMEFREGDMIITPLPAGSKGGVGKLLLGAALLVVTAGAAAAYYGMGAVTATGTVVAEGFSAAFVNFGTFQGALGLAAGSLGGQLALGFAMNLAITGLGQMMAPDPSTDADQEQSYLFNGAEQNIIEGDPVPILYGHLRIPGQPISFEIGSSSSGNHNKSGGSAVVLPDSSASDPTGADARVYS